jgi:hypothetical protein
MKKILLLICFSCTVLFLSAQNVGINSTGVAPNTSAILDISASDKGVLVPRVSLSSSSDATTIISPAPTLLVWNLNASMTGGAGTGYYYNAGTAAAPLWVKLLSTLDSSSSGWLTTGNAGTSASTNFLGTTDQRSLAIRTTNTVRILVDSLHGNIGIGTVQPSARLHVADSNVLFSAAGPALISAGGPPASGTGRRMMWYADKAAFRVGYIPTDIDMVNNWDEDSIGNYSFASGLGTKAKGSNSTAMGNNTEALAPNSTALGFRSLARGLHSVAIGHNVEALSPNSVAIGFATISQGIRSTAFGSQSHAEGSHAIAGGSQAHAQGAYSTALGELTHAQGMRSTALGNRTHALGGSSFAVGEETVAIGAYATAAGFRTRAVGAYSSTFGRLNTIKSIGGFVTGMFNDTLDNPNEFFANTTDRIFVIGNGSADNNRSNALTILRNGNIGLNAKYLPEFPLSFSDIIGNKISFFQDGNSFYGIGVNTNLLQIFSNQSGSDIAFGFGNSFSFSENMRIKGNGNVGIGVNPTIDNKLQVNGKTQTTNLQLTSGAANNFILRSDATGNATWVNPSTVFTNVGTLDQAYDFGGAGLGRTITANANAVLIQGTDGLQITGTFGSTSAGYTLAGGANPKLLFIPSKGAFRAGRATALQWDLDSIGNYSFAGGTNTKAIGAESTAFGNQTTASGLRSFASGYLTQARASYSSALGYGSITDGLHSMAVGFNPRTDGTAALASGIQTRAMAYASSTFGLYTVATSYVGMAVGMYNDTSDAPGTTTAATDRLFQVGNGSSTTRSNAFTVLKNGNVSVGSFYDIPSESRLVIAAATNGVNEGGQIQLNAPSSASWNTAYFMDVFQNQFRIMTGTNTGSSTARFTMLDNGNVGIGITPTERLHVNGKLRIVDGTQANNNFLSSDANGVTSWKPVVIKSISGVIGAGRNIPHNTTSYQYTGSYIILPPGKYSVSVTMLMSPTVVDGTTGGSPTNSSFWLRSTFADASTLTGTFPNQIGTSTPDIIGGNLVSAGLVGPSRFQMLVGEIIINNTTAGNKTYYYIAGNPFIYNTTQSMSGFGGSSWGENRIIAIPVE